MPIVYCVNNEVAAQNSLITRNYMMGKHTSNKMSMLLCQGVIAICTSPPCVNAMLSLPLDLSLGEYELLLLLYVLPDPEDKAPVPLTPPAMLPLHAALLPVSLLFTG